MKARDPSLNFSETRQKTPPCVRCLRAIATLLGTKVPLFVRVSGNHPEGIPCSQRGGFYRSWSFFSYAFRGITESWPLPERGAEGSDQPVGALSVAVPLAIHTYGDGIFGFGGEKLLLM